MISEPDSFSDLFFESTVEAYNWLKNINADEKDIFVDNKYTLKESLTKSFLKTVKEILVLNKLIGA
ncbi:MAG: hypothetical protein OQJ81_04675 [Melioribacteraceae bacterium]|nr:hypothetical protein [Melioribacteraceae bacterium]